MDSLWIPYGFLMVSLWIPYGFPMDSLWIPYGFPMDSLQIPCGFLMHILRCKVGPKGSESHMYLTLFWTQFPGLLQVVKYMQLLCA